jgi:hypothetical protein
LYIQVGYQLSYKCNDVRTSIINTHILNRGGCGEKSPVECQTVHPRWTAFEEGAAVYHKSRRPPTDVRVRAETT